MQENLFKERNETNDESGQSTNEGEHAVGLRKAVKSDPTMVFSLPSESKSGWTGFLANTG